MSIHPLPQFEADLAEYLKEKEDREAYERLRPPTTMVVRFGSMRMVGEFPYQGESKPGCGSKLVVRTHRGTEMGEMLTSTCPNAGCSKSVTRKEMLEYIDNSGGRDYPFSTNGKVLRIATKQDMDEQAALEQSRHALKLEAREAVERLGMAIKIVDAEPILGRESLTFFYIAEERTDMRELIGELGRGRRERIEMRQIGSRDEARVTADYERCGQYCCCKSFLKVLKPVSMRSAKTQKATLDPLKISGRCGRLMCCLRYEDSTYEELKKNLPKRKKPVGTPEGDGIVIDTQILTQLALVLLDGTDKRVAVPIEELTEPTGRTALDIAAKVAAEQAETRAKQRREERGAEVEPGKKKRRRRRRRGKGKGGEAGGDAPRSDRPQGDPPAPEGRGPRPEQKGESGGDGAPKKKRRRRRRRGKGKGGSAGGPSSGGGGGGGGDS